MKQYSDINLMQNRLQQARLDPVQVDPDPTTIREGQIWYNMTEDVFKYFDGREIQIIQRKNFLTVEDIDVIWALAEEDGANG